MESDTNGAGVGAESPNGAELSEREHEILRLVATGASNKQIAQQLVISPNTVKVHLRNIFGKIGVATRTEATLYAIRHGLVQMPASAQPPLKANGQLEAELPLPPSEPGVAPINPGAAAVVPPARRRTLRLVWVSLLWVSLVVITLALTVAGVAWWRQPKLIPTSTSVPAPTPAPLWRINADLPTARAGIAVATFESLVYAIGGDGGSGVSGTVERYDLATNTWTTLSPKTVPVTDVSAGVIGGLIYVPGGRLASGQVTNLLEVYDPQQDHWETRAPLPAGLSGYALAAFEGRLYVFGGWNGQKFVDTVYAYSPDTNSWAANSPMPIRRGFAAAAVAGGKIYVIGGTDGTQTLAVNEAYIPENDTSGGRPWETHTPLPASRSGLAAASVADTIHVIGGETGNAALPAMQYSPRSDQWHPLEAPPADAWPVTDRWTRLGLTAVESNLVAVGGLRNDTQVGTTLSYRVVFTIILPGAPP